MKKILVVLLSAILMLSGCSGDKLSNEEHFEKSIEKYYEENQPHNNGTLIIEQIKEFENKYLVMCEKYSGDGHGFDDLFLIDNNFNITHVTHGYKPLSPCFSYNKFELYNDNKEIQAELDDTIAIFDDIKFVDLSLVNQ